jgi:hypothetical protein
LDVTTYRDGTVIPQVRDANEWMDLKTGLGVIITMTNNGTTYGKLYNWYAEGYYYSRVYNTNNRRNSRKKKLAPRGWAYSHRWGMEHINHF